MALDKLTIINNGGLSTTSDYRVGVLTATKFVGPIESDSATFNGSVSIGGTLTYEDVTNIDSVGIITARDGIDCNGDIDVDGHTNLDNVSIAGVSTHNEGIFIPDNKEAKFGNSVASPDLKIYSDGTTSNIDNATNELRIESFNLMRFNTNDFRIYKGNLTELTFRAVGDGPNYLYHNGSLKFETSPNGVDITGGLTVSGDIDVDGHTNLDNVSIAGVTTISYSGTAQYGLDVYNPTSGGSGLRVRAGDSDSQYSLLVEDGSGTNLFEVLAGGGGARLRSGDLSILDKIAHYGDGNTFIRFPANDTISFETAGDERLRIDSYGRLMVGGGSNNLNAKLQVKGRYVDASGSTLNLNGTGNDGPCLELFETGNTANRIALMSFNHGSLKSAIGGGRSNTSNWGTDLRFYTHKESTSDQYQVYEKMRITAAGNVGIATNNPSTSLHILGAGNQRQDMLRLQHAGQRNFYIQGQWGSTDIGGANGILQYIDGGHLAFRVGSSGKADMMLDQAGKVGIATDDPQTSLHVLRGQDGFRLERDATNPGYYNISISHGTPVGANNYGSAYFTLSQTTGDYVWSSSTSERMRLKGNGHLGVGDNNPDTRLSVTAASGTDVVGKFTSTDANAWIQFRDNTTTDTAVMVGANGDDLLLRAGSNTRLRITSTGRIEVGTGSGVFASAPIEVKVSSSSGWGDYPEHISLVDQKAYNSTDNGGGFVFGGKYNNSGSVTTFGGIHCKKANTTDGNYGGILTFNTREHGNSNFERMRIDSFGRVFINSVGATTPTADYRSLNLVAHAHTEAGISFSRSSSTMGGGSTAGKSIVLHSNGDLYVHTHNVGEDVRIDSSGRVLIGHTSSRSHGGIDAHLQLAGTGTDDTSITLSRFDNSVHSPYLVFAKSRGASIGSDTIVQNGDSLGRMTFFGNDGTDGNTPAAEIDVEVDGDPGTNDMPGRIVFKTTANNASSVTERLRITADGKVLVGDGNSITPSRNLDVRGTGHQQILLGSTNNAGVSLIADGQGGGDGSGGLYCTFEAASDGHLKIRNYDPTKSIIFGTGSNTGANDSVVIESNGKTRIKNAELSIESSASYTTHLNYNNTGVNYISSTNGGATYFRGSNNSITALTVKGNGTVELPTANYEFTENNFRSKVSEGVGNNNPATLNGAMTSLEGSKHSWNNTGGILDLTDYKRSDWQILEVFGEVNPNTAGSGVYSDPFHMTIYQGYGWNGSSVTSYIYAVQHSPIARDVYPSGTGNSGNDGITVVWYNGSSESTSCAYNSTTHYLRIKLDTGSFNTTYGCAASVRIFKRF